MRLINMNMMNCLIDICTHYSSVFAPYVLIRSYGQVQNSIYISLLKFKLMILQFSLTETFSETLNKFKLTFVIQIVYYAYGIRSDR